jgi:hypothetical protein
MGPLQKFLTEEINWAFHEDDFEDGDMLTEVLVIYRGVKPGKVQHDGSMAEFHGYVPNNGSSFTTLRGMLMNLQDRFGMEAMHQMHMEMHPEEEQDDDEP